MITGLLVSVGIMGFLLIIAIVAQNGPPCYGEARPPE